MNYYDYIALKTGDIDAPRPEYLNVAYPFHTVDTDILEILLCK